MAVIRINKNQEYNGKKYLKGTIIQCTLAMAREMKEVETLKESGFMADDLKFRIAKQEKLAKIKEAQKQDGEVITTTINN